VIKPLDASPPGWEPYFDASGALVVPHDGIGKVDQLFSSGRSFEILSTLRRRLLHWPVRPGRARRYTPSADPLRSSLLNRWTQ